ncbi:hypothetical protein HPT29_018575 [Microvirga terrae]|uniref:Transcriptional regulator n=1 Tax=Microvirga terrae TaxID=2740529 RepID=A0ABY5RNA5_9HYPH|nr:hypothetical protein [Microvirga terrae]UVF18478.1 hypothetical protein HPT29_018575 [Microvirga terrae]
MTEQPQDKIRYTAVPPDELEAFQRLCEGVFGPSWVNRLATFARVAHRTAHRWSVGEQRVPEGVIREIQEQRDSLAETAFWPRLNELVDEVVARGVSPVVVAAYARDLAASLRPEPETAPQVSKD